MANRAYLYFIDDISALTFEQHYKRPDGSERLYMDSRHQLPLAWLLFFRPSNVQLVLDGENGWYDLYFVREWSLARDEFLFRIPLLLNWFQNDFSDSTLEQFLEWLETLIANHDEKFLVIDPSEVVQDSNPELNSAPRIRLALESLEDSALDNDEKFESLDIWSSSKSADDPSRRYEMVFGNYYGGYFE